jgi:hypothetical protein
LKRSFNWSNDWKISKVLRYSKHWNHISFGKNSNFMIACTSPIVYKRRVFYLSVKEKNKCKRLFHKVNSVLDQSKKLSRFMMFIENINCQRALFLSCGTYGLIICLEVNRYTYSIKFRAIFFRTLYRTTRMIFKLNDLGFTSRAEQIWIVSPTSIFRLSCPK